MSEVAASQPVDRRSADVALICTHEAELRPLIDALDRIRRYTDFGMVFRGGFLKEVIRVAIVEAGHGYAKHRQAAEVLIAEHRPAWLISAGFCASLATNVQATELCVANELVDGHGQAITVKGFIKASAKVHAGRMLTTDFQPQNASEKQTLAEQSSAICCDTTSLAVAQVCESLTTENSKHQFLAVKTIVEAVDDSLPQEIYQAFYDPAAQRPTTILGKLKALRKQRLAEPWQQRQEDSTRHLNRYLMSVIQRMAEKLGKTVY